MTLRKLAEQDHDRIQAYDDAQREARARRYRADLVEALMGLGVPYALAAGGAFSQCPYFSNGREVEIEGLTVEEFTFALDPYDVGKGRVYAWDYDPEEGYIWTHIKTLADLLTVTKEEDHASEESA